jgi:hypothetical protein
MKNSDYLINRVFLIALFGLLFNDLYLKTAFPSVLSGKLSDVSGLIVFAFFFTFLLGKRFKTVVFVGIVFLFCWWKSSLSSGFISDWNELFPFYAIDRVVDYSDLIYLAVLIPVYFYQPVKRHPEFNHLGIAIPVLLLSIFAITATSKAKHLNAYDTSVRYSIQKSFRLKMTRAEFLENVSLSNITIEKNPNAVPPSKPGDPHGYLVKNFTIRDGLVVESIVIGITEKKNCIKLMIYEVSLIDPPAGSSKEIKKLMVRELEEFFDMEK